MARYFFHYLRGRRLADPVGEEFASRADAEDHACIVAAELSRNMPAAALIGASIVVLDASHKEVFRVSLSHH